MKRYRGQSIMVDTYKRGGYYILRITNYCVFYVATKHSRKAHLEEGWMPSYEMKFERKESANKYFLAIKKSNPDLKMISDEPNKYISALDGKVREY